MSPRRRSRQDYESEDEASSPSQHGSSTSKRQRLSIETGGTSPLDDGVLTNGNPPQADLLQRESLRARISRRKHQPGSIVRVKLDDFVTYTAVEFFPGPSLNMVIGPNGTGKSTLVCAICLGLGWGPQHLGRAKEVSEYVKHGCQEATIEIELAKDGKQFKKNVVIRCTIKREGNKSFFTVDGRPSSKKAVVELARSLSIQIDNLCQFLPQDKVVEFAAMSPVELLRSTQRAVATQEMIDIHEELKDYGKKRREVLAKSQAEADTLANLEGRQRLQEADVERMREREQTVKRVEMLEASRPFAQYRQARLVNKEASAKKKDAQTELKTLQDEVEPALRAVNAKQQYQKSIELVAKERKNAVTKAETHADKIDRSFVTLHDKSVELAHSVEAEKKSGKKHKSDVVRIEGNINRLKLQLEEPPAQLDVAGYNERIREKQRNMDNCEREIHGCQNQQRELAEQGRGKNQQIADAEYSLKELDSQAGKQNMKLQNNSRDTYKLWEYVQTHQNEFEKQVFGPPLVECSVKDPKYVNQLEALFQRGLMLSFTVQTSNDFKTLSNIAGKRLRISEANIETMTGGLDDFRNAVSEDDKRRFGFDGWALDYLDGPEPVLAMLCSKIKFHEIGVADRDTAPQQFDMLQNSSISFWVTSRSNYRISRRREYGPGATSTQVRETRRAQIWTDQPVDTAAKREILDKIESLQNDIGSLKAETEQLRVRIDEYRKAYRTSQTEMKETMTEKSTKQQAISEFKGLPTKLAAEESKVAAAQEFLTGVRGRLKEIYDQQEGIAMDRAKVALNYADAVESLRIAHNALHEVEVMFIEATSDLEVLGDRNREVKDLLETKERSLSDIFKEADRTRKIAQDLFKKCSELLAPGNDEFQEFVRTLPAEQTAAELESEIDSEKARLELMHEGNGTVIREFETRQKRIDHLTSRLTEIKAALAELEAKIDEKRGQWEPQLDALVSKISDSFSYNMQQISCAGEVGVHKEDDFDQWAIQIRVKFRESEPLTTLDSHRQSGGERAVSTIFYLMSLQTLTRSPFRVVDEINQGMDPRNERLVHKRMVGIACGTADLDASALNTQVAANANGDLSDDDADNVAPAIGGEGSQYFLITPKLLHDLEYARGMQVMCIASGEYVPEEKSRLDFRHCVDLMRGLKAERRGMAIRAAA